MLNNSEKKLRWGLHKSPYEVHMKCLNLVEEKKTVLDVGCATGYLSHELKKKGCYVVGLEKNQQRAKIAQKYCDKVIIGDADTIELAYRDYFNAVLCVNVIGYFRYPEKVLAKFRYCLKRGGYIVMSVPNIANWSIRLSLLFGNFYYRKAGILAAGQLRLFTAKTMKEMLKQSGFKIESLGITTNLRGSRFGFVQFLASLWKNLFASQFIIKAKVDKN